MITERGGERERGEREKERWREGGEGKREKGGEREKYI
jgi:hypothetical protein